jgi:hypothetical protein
MDAYFGAVFGELQRDPSTDTTRTSGDQGMFLFERNIKAPLEQGSIPGTRLYAQGQCKFSAFAATRGLGERQHERSATRLQLPQDSGRLTLALPLRTRPQLRFSM